MELLDRALELPEVDRAAFLQAQGDDTEGLRDLLASLIEADGEADADAFLEKHLEAPAVATPTAGDRVGPYKLLHEIGRGGMGVVYLATRDDDTFDRQVAVKWIHQDKAGDEDSRRRLRIERRILASLDHPGIAALHDGGTTPEGVPYFVMDYVEGVPIDAYCDQKQLPFEERLALFIRVCGAVEFAHRNFVVHRDLKPSNILVNSLGEPKLLDFGIAKLLDPALAKGDSRTTEIWKRIVTPEYASPEHIEGRPVTTASDVYSLGVLLFKLLTGRVPFPRAKGERFSELVGTVSQREAPRASRVVLSEDFAEDMAVHCRALGESRELLARRLAGDLDSILAKALRNAPDHRYATVDQMVEDLRRYRSHLPVAARQGNFRYQAGKFLRRHFLWLGAAALVFTVVLGFGLAMALQAERIRQERDSKEAVMELVIRLFESADVYLNPGESLTVLQALEHGEEWLDQIELEPEVSASLGEVIGKVYLGLGKAQRARERFSHLLEIDSRVFGKESLEAARAHRLLGEALREDDIEAAVEQGRKAVAMVRAKVDPDDPELVMPLNSLVATFCYQGAYDSADELSKEALALARRWFGSRSLLTTQALTNRAVVLEKQDRLQEAMDLYTEALTLQRRLLPRNHIDTLDLLSNKAILEEELGHPEKAEETYHRLLKAQRETYDGEHWKIALTLNNLSALFYATERMDESLSKLCEAVSMARRTFGADRGRTISLEIRLARRFTEAGRPREAQAFLAGRVERWRSLELEAWSFVIDDAEAALKEAAVASGEPSYLPTSGSEIESCISGFS